MVKVILQRSDGSFFSEFDAGCPCWTLHENDAKMVDTVADKFMIDVLENYGPIVTKEVSK